MLADKYIRAMGLSRHVQAALRYPGVDVVYEGMMASSIDDGGLEFRGTNATPEAQPQRLWRLSRGRAAKDNPVVRQTASAMAPSTTCRISSIVSRPQRAQRASGNRSCRSRAPARSPIWPTAAPVRSLARRKTGLEPACGDSPRALR